MPYEYRQFPVTRPPELDRGPRRVPVLVVGAGPVGLTAAIDLAMQGIDCVVVDKKTQVSDGSRAICWAKRSLEIFGRLGAVEPMLALGVTWSRGKVHHGDALLYEQNLQPDAQQKYPSFINLQQYFVEDFLVARAEQLDRVDLRFGTEAAGVRQDAAGATVTLATPEGTYELIADYVLACDGARSGLRRLMGLDFVGRVFEDRFLIADVRMKTDFPNERWFWYHPTFHAGPSALMHRQANDVFRIDFQLHPDVDPEEETRPERVRARIEKMLGPDVRFDFEWISLYRFQARRLETFRHGRVFFAGDAAHQLSPFGGRGGNSGIQDVDNLVWKLVAVRRGEAADALLDSYGVEREFAADENLRITNRTTEFMSAKPGAPSLFRDAALTLARDYPFGRALVNAGRLTTATEHTASPLNVETGDAFDGGPPPGAPFADGPILETTGRGWLADLTTPRFGLLYFHDGAADAPAALAGLPPAGIEPLVVVPAGRAGALRSPVEVVEDVDDVLFGKWAARDGTAYLMRPDAHVAARWRRLDPARIVAARAQVLAGGAPACMAGGEQA